MNTRHHSSFLRLATVGAIAFAALAADAALLGARPDRVAAVREGRIKEAQASWWGFDPEDSTASLQAAIDSGVPVLHVDAFAGPWIVRPLKGVSNQKIVFDPWVEVRAKKGAFLGLNDCLITYRDAVNVTLSGPGAALRMNRWDYHAAPYAKGEWRHAVSLLGCSNIVIEGLTIAESGGDGIYVSTSSKNTLCRNVTIRDCILDKNYRQGISVISADGLLIERTVMRETAGTPPAAGIDFEPNHPWEVLKNCVMRDCVCEDNQGHALDVCVHQLNRDTEPVSIRVQNTRLRGSLSAFHLTSGDGPRTNGYARGVVGLENCLLEKSKGAAININESPATAVRVALANCLVREAGLKNAGLPEVMLTTNYGSLDLTDGLLFRNVRIAQTAPHPWINKVDCSMRRMGMEAICGDVTLETPAGEKRLVLDASWRASYYGAADPTLPPYIAPSYTPSPRVTDAHSGAETPLAPFRVRGSARYAFYAAGLMTIAITGRRDTYGNPKTDPWRVVRATEGRAVATGTMPGKMPEKISFAVPEAGFYVFEPGLAGRHGFVMSSANVPMALEVPETGAHFIAGGATGYVAVSGARRFFVFAQGAGGTEFLSVALADPSGKEVWRQNQIEDSDGWKSADAPSAGLWRLTTGRPNHGCFEDHYISLGGVPGWLFLSSDRYWTSATSLSKER